MDKKMKKCQDKNILYNPVTKRCYKSCEQKNKVTHPITKKCRKPCNKDKIRRLEDFRCVKPDTQKKRKTTVKKNKTKKLRLKPVPEPEPKPVPEPKPKPAPAPKRLESMLTEEKKEQIAKEKPVTEKPVTEQLIPEPLQKSLAKNFSFLEGLIQKGKGKVVDYHASDRVSEIITIYFYKKYKQECPMYPIKTYNTFDQPKIKKFFKDNAKTHTHEQIKRMFLTSQRADYRVWDKDKFLTNLKLCLDTGEQLVIVPVRVPGHFNMLFIKVATREIIRFEPHGKVLTVGNDKNINTFLNKLTDDINKYLNLAGAKKFTYKPPTETCPRNTSQMPNGFYQGFQEAEIREKKADKRKEGGGFCVLWSWFFAECVMANPEMDIKEVYKEAWDAIRTNELGFATIIRGYFISINEELVKMNKTFSIDKKYIYEHPQDIDMFLAYLDAEREHLKKKPRKIFQDGGKKFILPAPNPKAKPLLL